MQHLRIDLDFCKLIPPPTNDERQLLEQSLQQEGCRDALVIWKEEGILLDGHNRYEICTAEKIEFRTVEISLPDRTAAVRWIIDNQLARRNLTALQAEFLRGKRYELEKTAGHGTKSAGQNVQQNQTAERLAEEYGVDEKTIRRDAKFATAIDRIEEKCGTEVKNKILAGQTKIAKQDVSTLADCPAEVIEQAVEADKEEVRQIVQHTAKAVQSEWTPREKELRKQLNQGLAVVVNMKTDHNLIDWARMKGLFFPVDRSSQWGNPFLLDDDGNRDQVCDKYERRYFPHKVKLNEDVASLKGKALGCHCSPLRCHADYLARLANGEKA